MLSALLLSRVMVFTLVIVLAYAVVLACIRDMVLTHYGCCLCYGVSLLWCQPELWC